MSEQQSTVLNGPSGEVTMAFKDAPPPQESKPFSNTQQPYPPGEYYQRPPLARIDSRSSLQPRPNYPNQPRPPLPPGQQYIPRNPAALPPRPPYVPQRPNQPQQQYRPATPYPRQQFQSAQRPQIFQQRSVPNPLQPRPPFSGEQTLRSQTLDHSELGRNDEQPEGGNYRPPMTSGLNRSLSLSSGTPEVNVEERRRTASAVDGSGDAPDEFSRPESRGGVRMNRISEDDDVFEPSKVGMQKKEGDGKQQGFGGIQEGNVEVKKSLIKENEAVEIPQKTEVKKSLIKENETVEIPQKMEVPRTPTPVKREDIKVPESPKIIETPKSPIPTKKIEPEIISQKSDEIKKSSDNEKNPLAKDRATPDMSLPLKPKTTFKTEGDNDSGVDESTQGNEQSVNGERSSPRKPVGKLPVSRTSSTTPTKSRSASRGPKSPNPKTPDSINSDTSATSEKKKVPMNKVQVGSAPSPNLKVVKSKIGSLQNANYKPGGGNVKIENRKIEIRATPRIAAKNEAYVPGGGDKKIQQQKLVWNAKSKIGSLENATHKPKGGDKKIETVKLDFKEKAKPKVGSKDNIKHVPGGGDVKSEEEDEHNIENQKLDIKVQSKVGSLDNVKHKPGGGDKKIFDDKDYLRQKSALSNDNNSLTGSQNSLPSHADAREPASDENLNRQK